MMEERMAKEVSLWRVESGERSAVMRLRIPNQQHIRRRRNASAAYAWALCCACVAICIAGDDQYEKTYLIAM